MKRDAAWRGQPVVVLLALLIGWLALRTAMWETPFARIAREGGRPVSGNAAKPMAGFSPLSPVSPRPAAGFTPRFLATSPADSSFRPGTLRAPPATAGQGAVAPPELAAQRAMERPPQLPGLDPPRLLGDSARPSPSRWSSDIWLLLRRDTTTPITSGRGSYGRSQLGSVLRYRLAPDSGHRPTAFVRASAAVSGRRELELAAGLSARPLPGVPLVIAGEMRAARFGDETEARPAAFAYTELPPLALPFGARAEAYVQAGFVGGTYATGFVDGQVRVERPLVRLGPAEVRAGAGMWGGAQKGAKRVDAGPGLTVALDIEGVPLRVTGDWRFRIAGEANPDSGPALTVSTGF